MVSVSNYLNLNTSYQYAYIKNNIAFKNQKVTYDFFCQCVSLDAKIILSKLNISPTRKGYYYWRDAIIILLSSGKEDLNICKEIYGAIAGKYSVSSESVERAMRICFEKLKKLNSISNTNFVISNLHEYLIYPKNGELLFHIGDLMSSRDFQEQKFMM